MKKLMNGSLALLALAAIGLAGCGDDNDDSMPGMSGANTVNVTVQEFKVTPTPATAKAGSVKFVVTNGGTEVHEFVVVKTDLAPAQLPTNVDGSFNEDGAGVEVMDEIEGVPVGMSESLTVSLAAGHYALLCNIVEDNESHFHEGMVADFMVQ